MVGAAAGAGEDVFIELRRGFGEGDEDVAAPSVSGVESDSTQPFGAL